MRRGILTMGIAIAMAIFAVMELVYAGGDIGSGVPNVTINYSCAQSDYFECIDYVSGALSEAQAIAATSGQSGNFSGARGELARGIRKALSMLRHWRYDFYPLTLDALKRGIVLNEQFTGECGQKAPQSNCLHENRRAAMFMSTYIEHIQSRIIPLDVEYRIPSFENWGRRNHYSQDWWRNYMIAYRQAAIELTRIYFNGRNGYPQALAIDHYELRIAEKILSFVVEDMNRDDYRRFFRFAIRQALGYQQVLHQWNTKSVGFQNGRQAVSYSRFAMEQVYHEIASEVSFRWEDGFSGNYWEPHRHPRNENYHNRMERQ